MWNKFLFSVIWSRMLESFNTLDLIQLISLFLFELTCSSQFYPLTCFLLKLPFVSFLSTIAVTKKLDSKNKIVILYAAFEFYYSLQWFFILIIQGRKYELRAGTSNNKLRMGTSNTNRSRGTGQVPGNTNTLLD